MENLSFEEAIEKENERLSGEFERVIKEENYNSYNLKRYSYLARGIYIDQIKDVLQIFPREQILILKSEDFFNNPPRILKQIFKFLNLPNFKIKEYKKYSYSNHPSLNDKTRKYLSEFYKPYNQRLYSYLKINFKW